MIGKKINQLATELAPVSTDLTIIGDPISGVSKKITLAQLGAIFSGAVSFYNNLASFPAVGDINVIYCAKDTQKLYLWNGSAYTEVFPAQALLDTYQLRSEKGVSNGYASLDSGGKVPISQLPSSIMEYKGMWNAATNTPTLANGTGDTGDVYICNVAGTVNFGAGPITFAVGDYVIYSGSIWQRSSGAVGTVTSVGVTRSGDALAITGSPITTSGTINLGFAGNSTQYINGAGNLVTFPGIINEAQNLITEVYNKTGATLTKGTVVYINGGQGNLPAVTKALATGDSTSAQTYGIVRNDITNNNNGYVVVAGRISDLDTQAYTEGTQLYLSPTTAGTWTSTKPYAPQHLVYVGIVVRAHPTQGVIEVKIQNGYEMDELHNVSAQSPSNNDILQYKTATSLWTKVAGTTSNIAEGSNLYYTDARSRAALSFTAGSGAYNSTTGVITIPTNTNQLTNGANYITLASLSAGAGISYNNTTGVIASTITQYTDAMARASISGGTGISYNSTTGVITNTITQYTDAMARASISLTTTGTSGAATYNSTTGVLNVPQYAPDLSGYVPTSRTLTINGTAFDLSANRSWSVGTVTSVGLSSATSGVTIGSTPVTTSGTITLAIATASGSQQGLLSSTDWNTFNNKQNALTNPVTGTGTTNYLPKFTGTSTIGNSIVQDSGSAITVAGNVGINGSPGNSFPLEAYINSSTAYTTSSRGNVMRVYNSNSGANVYAGIELGGAGPSNDGLAGINGVVTAAGSGALTFYTRNSNTFAEKMRIDASGNLGLGVTPSAWGSGWKAFQFGSYGFIGNVSGVVVMGNNYYDNGTNAIYSNTDFASRYYQFQGQHIWQTAPSGTAGNAISFTQAMTLDASGRLGIGTTSPSAVLEVAGTSANTDFRISRTVSSSTYFYIKAPGGSPSTSTMGVNGVDVMALNASGNVGIGMTTPNAKLEVTSGVPVSAEVQRWSYNNGNADFSLRLRQDVSSGLVKHVFDVVNNATTYSNNLVLTNGNVGIGTTSPDAALTIKSIETAAKGISIWGRSDSISTLRFFNSTGATEQGGFISTSTYLGFIYADTERMRITSGGNVLIGTTTGDGYKLQIVGNSQASSTFGITYSTVAAYSQWVNSSGAFVMGLDGAAGTTERMRITSGGLLGIGTTTANVFRINVAGHYAAETGSYATDGAGDSYRAGIGWQSTANPSNVLSTLMTTINDGNYGGHIVFLNRGNNGGNLNERMRITSGGAVQIAQTIQTGAPTNGTAQPWRLGDARSGSISTNSYIIVSVNGTTYSIPALNGLP